MELRHLRYFVAVAEEENVSRAALKLHVSQPGISRQIHDLEDEIGFKLFDRSPQSLRLTPAGSVFLGEARAVLERARQAVETARAADGAGGEISVGYAPSLTVRILPAALRKFQEQFPKVRVVLHDLSTEEMLRQLRQESLQLALTVQPPPRMLRGFHFEQIARYAMRVAVAPSHKLAHSKSVRLDQIAAEPLIAYSRQEYPEYFDMLDEIFAPLGQKPRIAAEHDSVSSLIAAVESGHGFALVPECLECMVGARLRLLPLIPAPPVVTVGAIWLGASSSPLAGKFIAIAQAGVDAI